MPDPDPVPIPIPICYCSPRRGLAVLTEVRPEHLLHCRCRLLPFLLLALSPTLQQLPYLRQPFRQHRAYCLSYFLERSNHPSLGSVHPMLKRNRRMSPVVPLRSRVLPLKLSRPAIEGVLFGWPRCRCHSSRRVSLPMNPVARGGPDRCFQPLARFLRPGPKGQRYHFPRIDFLNSGSSCLHYPNRFRCHSPFPSIPQSRMRCPGLNRLPDQIRSRSCRQDQFHFRDRYLRCPRCPNSSRHPLRCFPQPVSHSPGRHLRCLQRANPFRFPLQCFPQPVFHCLGRHLRCLSLP